MLPSPGAATFTQTIKHLILKIPAEQVTVETIIIHEAESNREQINPNNHEANMKGWSTGVISREKNMLS